MCLKIYNIIIYNMVDYSKLLKELKNNIDNTENDQIKFLGDLTLEELNNFLKTADLSLDNDPSIFYNTLTYYENRSKKLIDDFYSQIEDEYKYIPRRTDDLKISDGITDETKIFSYNCSVPETKKDILKDIGLCDYNETISGYKDLLELKYDILKINIEILKTFVNAERKKIDNDINDINNNDYLAHTLNDDYSEIYKYRYLRNWGIIFSIIGGVYLFKKIK